MGIIKKIASRSLILNKKRSIATTIGIILSTALLCAFIILIASFYKSILNSAIMSEGYYHVSMYDVDKEKLEELKANRDIKDLNLLYHVTQFSFEDTFLGIVSADEKTLNNLEINVKKGRLPKNSSELVVYQEVLQYGDGVNIGDKVKLKTGRIIFDKKRIKSTFEDEGYREYKIVGVIDGYRATSEGILCLSTGEKTDRVSAYISLNNPKNYKEDIPEILGYKNYGDIPYYVDDGSFRVNRNLLQFETLSFDQGTSTTTTMVFLIILFIIISSSVFCIRNSFEISITEKKRIYGMLSSVGATKRQIRKSVLREGLILSVIGIPIGLISGAFASFILVNIVNFLAFTRGEEAIEFVYNLSPYALILSTLLSALTIYLSIIALSFRASRVSPIENLRSSNDVKITSKKLKSPWFIKSIFKMGGLIAYKNLKRSRSKYRVTVMSIVISVMMFISVSTFMEYTFINVDEYLAIQDHDIHIRSNIKELNDKNIDKIRGFSSVDEMYTTYDNFSRIELADKDMMNKKDKVNPIGTVNFVACEDKLFRKYLNEVGVDYERNKDKAILIDRNIVRDDKGRYVGVDTNTKYKPNDMVKLNLMSEDSDKVKSSFTLEIAGIRQKNLSFTHFSNSTSELDVFVNIDYFNKMKFDLVDLWILTNDTELFKKQLDDEDFYVPDVYDVKEGQRQQLNYKTLVSIFLYGFIAVVSLIGITNIFNTITSNVNLRSREFATLKSIGMTSREFKNMIRLETFFYSSKALIYGIALGVLASYWVYFSINISRVSYFIFPTNAIIISIVAVIVMVYMIMRYSISKINKQNIIETIRKENI